MEISETVDFPIGFELNGVKYEINKPPSAWMFRIVNQNKNTRQGVDMESVVSEIWNQFVHPAEGDVAPADKPRLFDLNADGQNDHEDEVFCWFVGTCRRHLVGPLV